MKIGRTAHGTEGTKKALYSTLLSAPRAIAACPQWIIVAGASFSAKRELIMDPDTMPRMKGMNSQPKAVSDMPRMFMMKLAADEIYRAKPENANPTARIARTKEGWRIACR